MKCFFFCEFHIPRLNCVSLLDWVKKPFGTKQFDISQLDIVICKLNKAYFGVMFYFVIPEMYFLNKDILLFYLYKKFFVIVINGIFMTITQKICYQL